MRENQKKEEMRFKVQAAIAYPSAAKKIFGHQEEAEVVPDIEEYDPESPGFSQEGIDQMLGALEHFGFFMESIDGTE